MLNGVEPARLGGSHVITPAGSRAGPDHRRGERGLPLCEDAHRVLAALAASYPLVVDAVDVRSDAGRALMASHRAAMSPLVLLDDAFFSSGRLPRRKLEKLLKGRYGHGTSAGAVGESHHG